MATKPKMKLAGNVLDELLGLPFMAPGADDKIVKCVTKRIAETDNLVLLTFTKVAGGQQEDDVLEHVTLEILPEDLDELVAQLNALHTLGFCEISQHGS